MKEMMAVVQTFQADLSVTKATVSVMKNTIDTISVDHLSLNASPTMRK